MPSKKTTSKAAKKSAKKSPAKASRKRAPSTAAQKSLNRSLGQKNRRPPQHKPAHVAHNVPLEIAIDPRLGRTTKCTPEVIANVAQALSIGAYPETAAAYGGITRQTFYDWLRRGRAERARIETLLRESGADSVAPLPSEAIFALFSYTIEKALADAELRDVQKLFNYTETVKTGAQAEAIKWRLSRRFPKRWHQQDANFKIQTELDIEQETQVNVEGVRYTEVAVVNRAGVRITVDGLDLEARELDDEFGGDEDDEHRELEGQAARSLPM